MDEKWRAANDGTGARKWFVYRDGPNGPDWLFGKSDELVRFASGEAAQTRANQLNRG